MPHNIPPGFAEIIEQAQKLPVMGKATPSEVTSPFAISIPEGQRIVNGDDLDPEKIPHLPEYDYTAHVSYFVLPKDIPAYEEILNQILKAKAILRFEERNFTKEGDCIVVVSYLTYVRNARARHRGERGRDQD